MKKLDFKVASEIEDFSFEFHLYSQEKSLDFISSLEFLFFWFNEIGFEDRSALMCHDFQVSESGFNIYFIGESYII